MELESYINVTLANSPSSLNTYMEGSIDGNWIYATIVYNKVDIIKIKTSPLSFVIRTSFPGRNNVPRLCLDKFDDLVGYINDGSSMNIVRLTDFMGVPFETNTFLGGVIPSPVTSRTVYISNSDSVQMIDMALLKRNDVMNMTNFVSNNMWNIPLIGVSSPSDVQYWVTQTDNFDFSKHYSSHIFRIGPDMLSADEIIFDSRTFSTSDWDMEVDAQDTVLFIRSSNWMYKIDGIDCRRVFPIWVKTFIGYVISFIALGIIGAIMRKIVFIQLKDDKKKRSNGNSLQSDGSNSDYTK